MRGFLKTNITSYDGKQLVTYISQNDCYEAVCCICHGMAEHIERYEEFALKLVANNFKVYAYSHRGHFPTDDKENYGYMGNDDTFEKLVSDLECLIDYIKEKEVNKKIILFGHSMGSFVSNLYTIRNSNKIDKLILSGSGYNPNTILSPAILLSSIIMKFKGRKHRSKLIDKITFGNYNKGYKDVKTNYDWLNTDQNEVTKYIEDEYCGGLFTVSYFKYFFKGLKKINKNQNKIREDLKMLIISGSDDPVGNNTKGVKKLFEKLPSKNKVLHLIPNARHEILLEKNKDEIHEYIINFMKNY